MAVQEFDLLEFDRALVVSETVVCLVIDFIVATAVADVTIDQQGCR